MKQIHYCNFCASTEKNFQKWLNKEVEIITAKEFMSGIKCQNPDKDEHQNLALKVCFGKE
mgnify:FL=1|tara:strand:- start:34 stop:213 length:180 start_codon:yes stop_codon:yes gene_type:complete